MHCYFKCGRQRTQHTMIVKECAMIGDPTLIMSVGILVVGTLLVTLPKVFVCRILWDHSLVKYTWKASKLTSTNLRLFTLGHTRWESLNIGESESRGWQAFMQRSNYREGSLIQVKLVMGSLSLSIKLVGCSKWGFMTTGEWQYQTKGEI